jgi:hypothetical protein
VREPHREECSWRDTCNRDGVVVFAWRKDTFVNKILLASYVALMLVAGTGSATILWIPDFDGPPPAEGPCCYYVGWIKDLEGLGVSESNEAGFVDGLKALSPGTGDTGTSPTYNRQYSDSSLTGLPAATSIGALRDATSPPTAFNVSGYEYLLAKYGNTSRVWYVAGLADVEIPSQAFSGKFTGGPNRRPISNGLSHWTLFNAQAVPDGGVTVILLGAALFGVEALRRRLT